MAVVLSAVWRFAPEHRDDVMNAIAQLAPASRAEPGNQAYHVYLDPDEPGVVRLFEVYDDEEALAAHADSAHFRRFALAEAIPLLESRERRVYRRADV